MVKTKRVISLLLVMVMVMGLGITAFAEGTELEELEQIEVDLINEVEDSEEVDLISQPTEASEKIQYLVDAGLVLGNASGDLKLNSEITRAEVVAMITRLLGDEELAVVMKSIESTFSDIDNSHWANGYVNYAYGNNILAGYPDGTVRPDNNITYNEVITMLVRTVKPLTAKEEETGNWPTMYLLKASTEGLLEDIKIDNYADKAVRYNVFEVIYNTLVKLGGQSIVGNKVEAVIVENTRVAGTSKTEVVAEVTKDQSRKSEDREYSKGDTFVLELDQLKELGEVEELLGKAVLISFGDKDKVMKVELNENYTQVQGAIEDIDTDRVKVDGKWYAVRDDADKADNLLVAYYNNESVIYDKDKTVNDFLGKVELNGVDEFARLTVRNGNVVFIEAFDFKDVAYVTEDVTDKAVVEYANDAQDGIISKLYDVDKAKVLVYADNKLKAADYKSIKKGDVIHWFEDGSRNINIIVRPSKDNQKSGVFGDIVAKTVTGATEIAINVGKETYELVLNSKNRNAVYTTSDDDFRSVTRNYASELSVFDKQEVELSLDIFGNVQAIVSTKGGITGYGVIEKILGSEIKLVTTDGESKYYNVTARDTDFHFENGSRANMNDFRINDLVRVNVAGDTVRELVLVNNLPEKNIKGITKNVIEYKNVVADEAGYDYLASKVAVFDVSGRAIKVVRVEDFAKNYNLDKDVKGYVAYTPNSRNVEAIVITDAESKLNVDTDVKVAKVAGFRITGSRVSITLEDSTGLYTTHEIKNDKINVRDLKAGSVVRVNVSKDKDLVVTELEVIVAHDAVVFEVTRFDTRNGEITLADRNGYEVDFKLARSASEFGRITTGSYVSISNEDEKYGLLEVIVARDDAKTVTGKFVTEDEKAANIVKDAIKELPAEITLESEVQVKEIRTAYEELTEAQKELVTATEIEKLAAAEQVLADLKEQAALEELETAKTLLGEEIVTSEALVADEALYTPETWTVFEAALDAAKLVAADEAAELEDVTGATEALETAREALELA